MDGPLEDPHGRAIAALVDTLRFRLLVRCMEAKDPDCQHILDASTNQLLDEFGHRIAESERREALRRHRVFGEHPGGIGPSVGMDLRGH